MHRFLTRHSVMMPLLFCVVAGGFVLYRDSDFFVWNDSPGLVYDARPELEMWSVADQRKAASAADWLHSPIREIAKYLPTFGALYGGYRPLATIHGNLSLSLSDSGGPSGLQLLLSGMVYGALACSLFLVARRFAKFDATALLAVVLLLGSPPLVSSSWVIVVGLQAMVPLLICLALLLYWQIVEAPRGRWWTVPALAAVLLVGPWYREFCGISCLLIAFLELRRARRPTPLMAMAGLFFLHAVFPTALVKWLFYPELPLLPVTRMGPVGEATGFHGVHWEMTWMFLPLVPPLLVVLATVNGIGLAGKQLLAGRPRSWSQWKARGWSYVAAGMLPCLWLAIALSLFLLTLRGGEHRSGYVLGYVLCLYVAVVGIQVDLFLVIWFLLSFVPLMRVVQETVHFLYVLVPTSIILACTMESLWQRVAAWPGRLRLARYALALVLGVIVADQLLVIYGTRRVMQGETAAIRAVAAELRQRTARGSVVISNVIHGVEIKWAAGDHYRNYWTTASGVNRPECVVDDQQKFQRLLAAEHPRPGVYLLDCDFPRLPWKTADRHLLVHRYELEKRSLGKLPAYSATYPFADPLRHFISPQNVPFLGPPDLVNDFYRGRALDGSWFRNQVYAEYHLYEVTGPRVVAKGEGAPLR